MVSSAFDLSFGKPFFTSLFPLKRHGSPVVDHFGNKIPNGTTRGVHPLGVLAPMVIPGFQFRFGLLFSFT